MKDNNALLFINGNPPENVPNLEKYSLIACTDGAFHYLEEKKFPLERLDFISGDFDSHSITKNLQLQSQQYDFEIISTPNQNKTDFQKALEILLEKGVKKVDVYGGSGGEMDHFLGNITVALIFNNTLNICFFDEFSTYYFIPKTFKINNVKGKTISLYPFPITENISTKGLNWNLKNDTLDIPQRIGTRNFAKEEEVCIDYEKGNLLLFIGNKYL